jgi:hypothetical protein
MGLARWYAAASVGKSSCSLGYITGKVVHDVPSMGYKDAVACLHVIRCRSNLPARQFRPQLWR